MIAQFAAFALLQVSPTAASANEPANWTCAEPLIQRNYNRSVEAKPLALRISDECAAPYQSRPIENEPDRALEALERTTYGYRLLTFQSEIAQRIQQERRRRDIQLK